MYKLVIQDDEGKTTVVPLIRDEITVGRKEGNTIRLTERNVSRRHARIVRANGSIAIEDLDSYNGVRVNGTKIQGRQPLTPKDRVQIGDYLIEIKAEGDDSDTPTNDHHTQPIEHVEPTTASSANSIPILQDASDPDAQTTKMPAQLLPSALASLSGASSVPTVEMDAAPVTMEPVPTMPMVAPVPVAESDQVARLIVLSANFAGTEFQINRPAMVIGRTDDNDIVINHRSISRHHAKLVHENNHYAIVDLQSSNGVRVNGEDYGKVELRRGDLIDLGHVRMRFADPGDEYVFKPEDINDVTAGKSKSVWYGLLAVLVLLGGIGIFAILYSGGEASGKDQEPPQSNGPIADPPDARQKVAASGDDPQSILQRAKDAAEQRQWALAQVEADKLLAREAGNAEAKQLKEKAQQETANELRHQELLKAIEGKSYGDIAKKLNDIGKDSVYRAEAEQAHDTALDQYIEEQATPLLETRKCPQLQQLERTERRRWVAAANRLAALATECRNGGKPGGDTRPQQGNNPPDRTENPPPDRTEEPVSGKSFDELLDEAKAAYKSKYYAKALKLCNEALKQRPSDPSALGVCSTAACYSGNAKQAKRYYQMASGSLKDQIRTLCGQQGIDVLQ